MLRTHTLGEISEKIIGQKVKLCGWIDTIREHGKVIFFDLRDRYGKVQCVIVKSNESFENIKKLGKESCIKIEGQVNQRPKGSENPDLASGRVEVFIDSVEVLGKASQLPFEIDEKDIGEEIRMKFKFLDLRTEKMQKNLAFRSEVARAVREYFLKNNFIEIETPLLVKPTPEGARDYIVPSRVNPGKFYALPQSPQLYKQILMISGFDRYFSLAKCLRDEDLRQDRQPEHTQIDFEMSFVDSEDIMNFVEDMYRYVFDKVLGVKLGKFPRLTYEESMKKYHTDKPDLRKDKNNKKEFAFCWIYDFPLFAYNQEEGRWEPEHHMFTSPQKKYVDDLEKEPGKVRGELFDVVLNGVELGSGSIRINDPDLQERIMKVVGMSKQEAKKKFGFLLEAYKYGGPVHGGMGLGFDRLVALMLGYNDIREVIAFPKNKAAQNPMDGSPSDIDKKHLKDVHVDVRITEKADKKTVKSKKKTRKR
ncbi:aspartate--tRNA ligase [Candidatus Pacearchaeota archaeon]|nr:aspartate--tRNA ligase [Candidatus Pacearchaeota archaeon]MBD3283556.1 aspartate--tRNA ligase [Candidatus Pacearchaeota archaeon]